MADLPQELQFIDVRKNSSVIIAKEARQILPQNGTRFIQSDSGNTTIVFRVPNSENESIDFSTFWITADFSVEGLSAATYTEAQCDRWDTKDVFVNGTANLPFLTCCDSMESCIRSVHILCNGSEVERQDLYAQQETMLHAHTVSPGYANSVGAGCYLLNVHHYEKCRLLLGNATAARTSSNVLTVSFPLRFCGMSNLRSLVNTSMLGSGQSAFEYRLTLANANQFLAAGVFTIGANSGWSNTFTKQTTPLTYVLDNVRLNYDAVITSEAYTQSLKSYLASNQLTLPIQTYYTTSFDIPSTHTSWLNFTVSTQMSDIEAVFIAFFKADEQASYAFCSTDRLIMPNGLKECRLQINGKPVPNTNIRLQGNQRSTEGEAYSYLMKALRQNNSIDVIGNSNQHKEQRRQVKVNSATATSSLAAASADLAGYDIVSGSGLYYGVMRSSPPADTAAITVAGTNILIDESILFNSPSEFVLGFDVSKSTYGDEYQISGIDMTKSSGLIQVNLRFEGTPGVNLNAVVVVKHKRIIDVGLDNTQIVY